MKWFAFLYGVLILGIVFAADVNRLGVLAQYYRFPNADKIGHFVLFGLLSLLVNLGVAPTKPYPGMIQAAVKSSLLIAAFIGLEELSQIWIPTRTFSPLDLLAGYAGVAVFGWFAIRLRMRTVAPASAAKRS